MSKVSFVCPACGGNQFRVKADRKVEDMIGAPCASCGTPLTEEEIKRQARKIAADIAKKAFGKGGTTKINIKL